MTSGTPASRAIDPTARDIEHVELRIADRLRVQAPWYSAAGRAGIPRGSSGCDKRRLDAELREGHRELRICAAIERARRDDVVAVLRQGEQRGHLRRHAGGSGERRASSFERGDSFFQRGHRRIGDPRIHVAESLQIEQACRVIGAVEDKGGRLVDRQRACAGARIGYMPRMQAERVESVLVVGHGRRLSPRGGLRATKKRERACSDRTSCRDDPGVDAGPIEPAKNARVLDLDAAIRRPRRARPRKRFSPPHRCGCRAASTAPWRRCRPRRVRWRTISSDLRKAVDDIDRLRNIASASA